MCSHNMLGMRTYIGQTKQLFEVRSKKIKTKHNFATSTSQMCMGAKPSYLVESTTVTGSSTVLPIRLVKYIKLNTEQRHGHTN